ncbi:hypothetical protein M436DRAFT_67986 [Aureobasidium namibiae CBS 147.97]|uniref:CFEM domain-containing protein n=1 Tax=Aureobasidium namibiae CBS 147.97 TaxID=1043004 RepID=A0A074W743_9PEZI
MKFFAFLLITWAAGSWAAIIASCGSTCIARAIKKTGCAPSDSKCICTSEHYSGYLNYCIAKRCSASEKDAEIKSATTICSVVGAAQLEQDDSDASFVIQKRESSIKRNEKDRDRDSHHRGSGDHHGSGWNQPLPAHDHQPAPQPPSSAPTGPARDLPDQPGPPGNPPGPPKSPGLPPGHSRPPPGPPPPPPSSTTWFTPTHTHTVLSWN